MIEHWRQKLDNDQLIKNVVNLMSKYKRKTKRYRRSLIDIGLVNLFDRLCNAFC